MKLYTIVSFDILAMQAGSLGRALLVHPRCWRTRQEAEQELRKTQTGVPAASIDCVLQQEWVSRIYEMELVIEGEDE